MSHYNRAYDYATVQGAGNHFPTGKGGSSPTESEGVAPLGTIVILHGAMKSDAAGTDDLLIRRGDGGGTPIMTLDAGAASETPHYQNIDITLNNGLAFTLGGGTTPWSISFTILRPSV